jgi:LuxR family quorum sensing-dependent transcriptional regulator
MDTATLTPFADLQARMFCFAPRVDELRTPSDVLDELHAITTKSLPLCVLGAARFPLKSADWGSIHLGKSVFVHKDVPEGWWKDYDSLARGKFQPLLFLAKSSMASCTWTEVKRMLEPIGIDRWADELALKYGMRWIDLPSRRSVWWRFGRARIFPTP